MGSPMAFAAYHTIKDHLKFFQKSPDDYDEILTGDLSSVGSKVLKQCLKEEGIKIKNHNLPKRFQHEPNKRKQT